MGSPRITYNSINIDLMMGRTGLNQVMKQNLNMNEADSGKIEVLNMYGRFNYKFDGYFSQAVWYTLWAWWAWARQGKTFSFALDSDNVLSTTLDGSAASGQKVVPLTSTTGFVAGDVALVRAEDADDEFELIVIDSVDAGVSITSTTDLIYSYEATDSCRHKDYFPSVVTLDRTFDPPYTGVLKTTGKYFKHTFSFTEVI